VKIRMQTDVQPTSPRIVAGLMTRAGINKGAQRATQSDPVALLAALKAMAAVTDDSSLHQIYPIAAKFVSQMKALAGENEDVPATAETSSPAYSTRRVLPPGIRILRMKDLVQRTKLSRSTLYAIGASDPTFPAKIQLTARTVGYSEFSVDAWLASRAQPRAAA